MKLTHFAALVVPLFLLLLPERSHAVELEFSIDGGPGRCQRTFMPNNEMFDYTIDDANGSLVIDIRRIIDGEPGSIVARHFSPGATRVDREGVQDNPRKFLQRWSKPDPGYIVHPEETNNLTAYEITVTNLYSRDPVASARIPFKFLERPYAARRMIVDKHGYLNSDPERDTRLLLPIFAPEGSDLESANLTHIWSDEDIEVSGFEYMDGVQPRTSGLETPISEPVLPERGFLVAEIEGMPADEFLEDVAAKGAMIGWEFRFSGDCVSEETHARGVKVCTTDPDDTFGLRTHPATWNLSC